MKSQMIFRPIGPRKRSSSEAEKAKEKEKELSEFGDHVILSLSFPTFMVGFFFPQSFLGEYRMQQ